MTRFVYMILRLDLRLKVHLIISMVGNRLLTYDEDAFKIWYE